MIHVISISCLQTVKVIIILNNVAPEGEGEPAHVGGHATLPEVDHTLKVLLGQLLFLLTLLSILRKLHGHPVTTQEHIAVLIVEYP